MSGFWTKEFFFKGLNKPDLFKFISIILEISSPTFLIILSPLLISAEPETKYVGRYQVATTTYTSPKKMIL